MLSNQEYLQQFTNALEITDQVINDLCVVVKGTDSKAIYATATHNRVFNCDNSIINNYVFPLEADNYKHNQSIIEEQEVINTRNKRISFNIHLFDGQVQPYLCTKYPVVNPSTNEVIAIYCVFQKIPFGGIHHQILRAYNIYRKASQKTDLERYKLTKREKQVIFLFLSGLSSQEIAEVLSQIENKTVTKSTIDSLFTKQLRLKFDAYTRQGLFEKLMESGFDRYIPKDLFINIKLPITDLISY